MEDKHKCRRLGANARLEVLKNTGHLPQEEDSKRFNEALLNILLPAPQMEGFKTVQCGTTTLLMRVWCGCRGPVVIPHGSLPLSLIVRGRGMLVPLRACLPLLSLVSFGRTG
jgi:hypothetical protein